MNRSNLPLLILGLAFGAGVFAAILLLRKETIRGKFNRTCQKWNDGLQAEILTRRYYQQ